MKYISAAVAAACLFLLPVPTRAQRNNAVPVPSSREQLLRSAFMARNPKVTEAKVLELRSIGWGAGQYVLLGWGIRAGRSFEGSFEDELYGVFLLDNGLTRIERTLDIFPTCRWADCQVSIEKFSYPWSEIVVAGAGGYGDVPFRKTYAIRSAR